MAVKKGVLDNFLKPSSHYSDNQKNLRSIFIDKNEDDLKPDPQNFLELSLSEEKNNGTQLEHNKNTAGTQDAPLPSFSVNESEKIIETQQEHDRNTTRTQQEHITNTSGTQIDHKKSDRNTTRTQQEHAKEHNKEHNKSTIGLQQEHNKNTNVGLSYLTGIQKQILIMLYISCKKTRSHTTEEFALINIATTLNIRLGSVKTSLRRLEDKGFIRSVTFKKGRGGWTKFELPEKIYRELLENDKEHNWNTLRTQQEHNTDTYRNTEKDTTFSSSSSLNNKETTTELGEEWDFDISEYAKFGFTKTHIKQISPLGIISATDVEQSLVEFNYDFETNSLPPIRTGKINLLMGLFRRGDRYVSENYINEQEKIIKEIAERAERKRKIQREEAFIAWETALTDEERKDIISTMSPHLIVLYRTNGMNNPEIRKWFFNYYLSKCST